jgi:hypothetical protein
LESNNQLPELETELNIKVRNLIELIKQLVQGPVLSLQILDMSSPKFDALFVETLPSTLASEYWTFLTDLHHKVKDD